jgi:hypothetical protein
MDRSTFIVSLDAASFKAECFHQKIVCGRDIFVNQSGMTRLTVLIFLGCCFCEGGQTSKPRIPSTLREFMFHASL